MAASEATSHSANSERSSFKNDRGDNISTWTYHPDGFEESDVKAICVIVHGIGDHAQAYEELAGSIWEAGKILLCGFDLVGHGMSDGKRVYINDFQYYIDDLLQYMEMVKKSHDTKKLFIMGHSMGGLVTGLTVLQKPDIASGIVMYAAAISTNPLVITPFKVRLAKIMSTILPNFPVGGIPDEELTSNTKEVAKLKNDPLRHHGSMKARWGARSLIAIEEFQQRLAEFSIPAYIAHGDMDSVCHYKGSVDLYEAIKEKNNGSVFKSYKDCYHRIHTEPGEGEKFVGDVCEWIIGQVEKADN